MDYDKIACLYQLALQIFDITHVDSHVRDIMKFCAENHYQSASQWIESHQEKEPMQSEALVSTEQANQVYHLCQSIINIHPCVGQVLEAIEYCTNCKSIPAIHWCTGYWTCYISCAITTSDIYEIGNTFLYGLIYDDAPYHQILANLLVQVLDGKARDLNGFTQELIARIECPYYCDYYWEGWIGKDRRQPSCTLPYVKRDCKCPCGDGNMWECPNLSLLTSDLFPDFETFPKDLVSIENHGIENKEWLDGYCACFLKYYLDFPYRKWDFQNNEYLLLQLCLDRFHVSAEIKKQAAEKFNALRGK